MTQGGNMSLRYAKLLSPIPVGGIVLKNRMIASSSFPHFVQGRETYPTDRTIAHFANKAKNGAAAVTVSNIIVGEHHTMGAKYGHPQLELFDDNAQIYFSKLTEAIHFYESYAIQGLMQPDTGDYDVSNGKQRMPPAMLAKGIIPPDVYEMPGDMIETFAQSFADQAALGKALGFDMGTIHLAYRSSLAGRFLSKLTNHRTDEYGGSLENRARLPLLILKKIKAACGDDYPIEIIVSAEEPDGGNTLEDTIAFAKLCEGYAEVIQVRAGDIDAAHPTGFAMQQTPFVGLAEAIRASGTKLLVSTIAGFQDLDLCEQTISTGKADMIAMARSFIADFDYGKKAYEGRGEDVVPCVRCNKCHMSGDHMRDPYVSVCTVNPQWGLLDSPERLIEPPARKKRVAVIGGGPAGMEAALVAAERGHQVTLYEKQAVLGGQLIHADYPSFKWPMKKFKDYLIAQLCKHNVQVLTNTEATPESLTDAGYEDVIVAIGAAPDLRGWETAPNTDIWSPIAVYGHEQELGRKVVIVGGSATGVETGMYLAECGHDVTVVTRQKEIGHDADTVHYRSIFEAAWNALDNFSWVTEAQCQHIADNTVQLQLSDGSIRTLAADSVIIAGGVIPRRQAAAAFAHCGAHIHIIGDCRTGGNVQKAMRSAFSAASSI
jgi:2,4-dienoyl-CoA reductase-like NADH-dependent reductase (Old Yellow Enzyme family)/thioredoxin reductase